jgi:hypothetical protein
MDQTYVGGQKAEIDMTDDIRTTSEQRTEGSGELPKLPDLPSP